MYSEYFIVLSFNLFHNIISFNQYNNQYMISFNPWKRVRIDTEKRLNSVECEEILNAAFWATFLEMRQPDLSSIWSQKLLKIIADNFAILLVREAEEKMQSLMQNLNKPDFFVLYQDLLESLRIIFLVIKTLNFQYYFRNCY